MKACLLVHQWYLLVVTSLSGASFIRGQIPSMGAPPSWAYYTQILPHWGLGSNIWILRGHEHSDHSIWVSKDMQKTGMIELFFSRSLQLVGRWTLINMIQKWHFKAECNWKVMIDYTDSKYVRNLENNFFFNKWFNVGQNSWRRSQVEVGLGLAIGGWLGLG